ncbi:MAG: 4-hydroxy-tetrahydrodipicolinate synthase [Nitrospinae bacterium]|nr:4-hydroxy-tetrahydrodipicolinate synthase [Nitrospinota bacterium]
MFEGAYTAIATPFKNNRIDESSFKNLIDFQVENGIHGIVVCGTTGESATLSTEEHHEVIDLAIKLVNKRAKVIAGTGSNNTAEAIELSKAAEKSGADGLLLISPYYNKPTQNGLYAHFKKIAESVSIPVLLYDVPGRTSVAINVETTARLYKDVKNIVGIKEATGSLGNIVNLLELVDEDFKVMSGDDFIVSPLMSLGGSGVISVTSNLLPAEVVRLCTLCKENNYREAARLQIKLNQFNNAMFVETNPIPVKYALYLAGFYSEEIRLPLTVLEEEKQSSMRELLQKYNIEVKN